MKHRLFFLNCLYLLILCACNSRKDVKQNVVDSLRRTNIFYNDSLVGKYGIVEDTIYFFPADLNGKCTVKCPIVIMSDTIGTIREFESIIEPVLCPHIMLPASEYSSEIIAVNKNGEEVIYSIVFKSYLGDITMCKAKNTFDTGRLTFSLKRGIYYYKYIHGEGCLKLPWEW